MFSLYNFPLYVSASDSVNLFLLQLRNISESIPVPQSHTQCDSYPSLTPSSLTTPFHTLRLPLPTTAKQIYGYKPLNQRPGNKPYKCGKL